MLLITSHSIAEHISRPSQQFPFSPPKSPTWTHMIPIIGQNSILGKEVRFHVVRFVTTTNGKYA